MKTGIFGGSFNPIHIGHLALANYLCEYEGLDEIWFMVSPQNPLKAEAELWPDELRLKLVTLATEDYHRFHASDFEFHLPRPSYSVHTLERLRETYPNREFYLIIGSDNWSSFDRWYQPERILQENPIMLYPRPGFPVDESTLPATVRLVHAPVFDISSTFIRQAIKEQKDVRYFVHPKVWAYLTSL
jgi:nicotinate-nucleotide adenylyltransferase